MNEEAFRRFFNEEIPFHRFLGLSVERFSPGAVTLRLTFRPEMVGDARRPALHGGVISTLIDTCGGAAVWSLCGMQDKIATIDMRVDYLRPAPLEDLLAESHVRLMGNRVGNAHVIVYPAGSTQDLLAEGRAVYNIRRSS